MCEACQLGKNSRLPFSSSSFSASRPLERIHCDLWDHIQCYLLKDFAFCNFYRQFLKIQLIVSIKDEIRFCFHLSYVSETG